MTPFDVALQGIGACHDIRIMTGPDAKGEDKCSSEVVLPNLILRTRTVITGDVRDETGAPFKDSEVVLRKVSDNPLQPAQLDAKTDANGAFTFRSRTSGITGYWHLQTARLLNPKNSIVTNNYESAISKSF